MACVWNNFVGDGNYFDWLLSLYTHDNNGDYHYAIINASWSSFGTELSSSLPDTSG